MISELAPTICPKCTTPAFTVPAPYDVTFSTLLVKCYKCGDVKVCKDGSRVEAFGRPIQKPPGCTVNDFNKIIRDAENAVREYAQRPFPETKP